MLNVRGTYMLKDGLVLVPSSPGLVDPGMKMAELLMSHYETLRSLKTIRRDGNYWVRLGALWDSAGAESLMTSVTLNYRVGAPRHRRALKKLF